MTSELIHIKQSNKVVGLPKHRVIRNSISRLAITSAITFGIGTLSLVERYNNYWNQTIYRVQTVDFNLLSHTLPTKLSYAINNNQPQELQRTLDSNYNLFGLVVTDPSGQKIIAASGGKENKDKSWAAALNPQNLNIHPYDVLLDPPPLFPQWSYKNIYDAKRTATSFTNQGRVIGRVYYVRGEPPALQDDFFKWLSNPFSQSSRIELYTATIFACIGGGIAFWSLWEYLLYKKRVQKQEAEQEAIRREEESRRKEEELIREAERREEQAKRKEEEARQREEILIQQNQTLELQLTERVTQLELLQKQFEAERLESIKQAEKLHSNNKQLQQEISQLKETIQLIPAVANSQSTQAELDKTRQEAELVRQKQHQQQEEIEQLNHQLLVYQNQLNSHLAPGNMDVKTKTTCERNQSLNIK